MVNDNADSTNDDGTEIQKKGDTNGIEETEESVCNSSISNEKNSAENVGNADLNVTDQSAKTSLFCSVPLNKIRSVLGYPSIKNEDDDTKLKQISRKLLCLYCDRTFVSSNLRQKHVERCHSEKQSRRLSSRKLQSQFTTTACFHCDKLPDEHSLKQLFEHLISKHSQKYFGCLICEERFLNQSLLHDHNAKLHGDSTASKWQKTTTIHKSQKENEVKETSIERLSNGTDKESTQKLTRSMVKDKLSPPQSKPQLRNKKITIKASKIGLKRSKRLQAAQTKVPVQKRKPKPADPAKTEETTKSSEKAKNTSSNPYPEFDNYYRVKKITDHSIDNLKISSLTFDDVFDQAFFNRIKCNIQENLLYHLDGKLFKNEESESRISNFEKNPPSHDVPSTSSENFGCDLSLNAITPVTSILSSNFGEDLESQIEYGAKPSKKKLQTRQDPVRHKYVTRRKYQASILERKENRDLSKLDMWTQIIIKDRQQQVANDQKSAKEMLEYTTCAEYKLKVQRNELNRILDRRGPFEDLKEEASKMAALDKLNAGSTNKVGEECFKDVRFIMDELLNKVDRICSNNDTNVLIKSEETTSRSNKADVPELPDYLKLRRSSTAPCDEEIDKSDKIILICSSQETENYELPTNTVRAKNEMVELSGEWARSRIYVCAACGLKLPNMKFLLDHKSLYHQSAWVQHYEFVGNQSELYRHLCIPGLGKVGHVEDTVPCKLWRRSEARVCSKCGKVCNALAELHRHVLECGGDWTWMLARKKCKYRPFGARKKRRGLVKRIRERINNQKTEQPEKKKLKKPIEGPRQRPSDADTIERMLANLPPKRSSRKIICLKDGFPRNHKKPNNSTRVMKCGKIVMKKSSYTTEDSKSKNASSQNNASVKRKLRSINRTLSSKIIDTTSKLRVKRQLIKNRNNRTSRSSVSNAEDVSSEGVEKDEQQTELRKGTSVGNNKGGSNSDRVKNILKEKMNIKHFFPVSKRRASKNVSSNPTMDENIHSKNEILKTTKNAVKKLIKKSFGFQKKTDSNKKQEDEVVNSSQPEENKSTKLSNKRKLRSSFRKVIDRVKKLKLDNTSSTELNRDVRSSNSFLGQGPKGKEKLATVLVPLVEDLKENPPSTPAFAQNAIDSNSPTEESLIPENIFNLEYNIEDLLQAKSPLETPMNDMKKNEPKNPFDTPTETKNNKFQADTNPTNLIETETVIQENETVASTKQDDTDSNTEEKEDVDKVTNQELPLISEPPSEEMSQLTIETETKGNKSPLVSPSMLSPKLKGKLRKPNRGLNDCIAMLTKKAFEETHKADNFLDVNVIEKIEEKPVENNQTVAHKFVRENECILKIPTFERDSRKNIQNEVLDLSKPKPNSEAEKPDVIDLSKKIWSPIDNTDSIAQNNTTNTSNLFNFWNPINSNNKFSNNISEKAILKIPKIVETSWTSVDDIIEKVVGNRGDSVTTSSNFQKSSLKVPSLTTNSVDKVIEDVIRGNLEKSGQIEEISKHSNELNNGTRRRTKKFSTTDNVLQAKKPERLPAAQHLDNLGKIIEEVATMSQEISDQEITGAKIVNCADEVLVEAARSNKIESLSKVDTHIPCSSQKKSEDILNNVQGTSEDVNESSETTATAELKICGRKNEQIRKRSTRNSARKTIVSNHTPIGNISETSLITSMENEPEILEAKQIVSKLMKPIVLPNVENCSPETFIAASSNTKDSEKEIHSVGLIENSEPPNCIVDSHRLVEDEPIILEEKSVGNNIHSLLTDSEDELPLLFLKNKLSKAEISTDSVLGEDKLVDAMSDDSHKILESKEENNEHEENILNSLNDLITGQLPFSSENLRKFESNEKQVKGFLAKGTSQSKKSQKVKNTGRRKSLRKSNSVSDIPDNVIVESKSIGGKSNILMSESSNEIEEKISDNDELVIDETNISETCAVPILRVTKIKSSKKLNNEQESVKAKLILKLPKIILKEPKLKIRSILDKSLENTTENRPDEPPVTIDLNMDNKPVSSITKFKKIKEIVQNNDEIPFKVKSKNKKKGSKHRKKLLISQISNERVSENNLGKEDISTPTSTDDSNVLAESVQALTSSKISDLELLKDGSPIPMNVQHSEREIQTNCVFPPIENINESPMNSTIVEQSILTNTPKKKSKIKSKKLKTKTKQLVLDNSSEDLIPKSFSLPSDNEFVSDSMKNDLGSENTLGISSMDQAKHMKPTSREIGDISSDNEKNNSEGTTDISDQDVASKTSRTLRSSTAEIVYKESKLSGPPNEEVTDQSFTVMSTDFKEIKNGKICSGDNFQLEIEPDDFSIPKLSLKRTVSIELKHDENKVPINKPRKHRKQSITKIQEKLLEDFNSIKAVGSEASKEFSTIPAVECTMNSKSIDPSMGLKNDVEEQEHEIPENGNKIVYKKENKIKKPKKEKSKNFPSMIEQTASVSDVFNNDGKISTNEIPEANDHVFSEESKEAKIAEEDVIMNDFANIDDDICLKDLITENTQKISKTCNDKNSPNINGLKDDINQNEGFIIESALNKPKNRKLNKIKKSKKEKNIRSSQLSPTTEENKKDLKDEMFAFDEIFKTDEVKSDIQVETTIQPRKRNKIKKTKREKFIKDAAYPYVDPMLNDNFLNKTEETEEFPSILKSKKEKLSKVDITTCCTVSENNIDPGFEKVNDVGNAKDAFEFEDDIMPIEELGPKFRRKNQKTTSFSENQNCVITNDENFLKHDIDTIPRTHDKKKKHKSKENSEYFADIRSPSKNLEPVEDLTRKQRTAKFKALENSLEMKFDESSEKPYGDIQKKQNEEIIFKKKKELKKNEPMIFDSSVFPRKSRAAKAKALESIRILEQIPDDILEEEKIISRTDSSLKNVVEDSGFNKEVEPSQILVVEPFIKDANNIHQIQTDSLDNMVNKQTNRTFRNRVFSNDAMELEPCSRIEKNYVYNEIHQEKQFESEDLKNTNSVPMENDLESSDDMDLEDPNEFGHSDPINISEYSERPLQIVENCSEILENSTTGLADLESLSELKNNNDAESVSKHRLEDNSRTSEKDMDLDSNSEYPEKNNTSEDFYDINRIDEDVNLNPAEPSTFCTEKDTTKSDISLKINENSSKGSDEIVSIRRNRVAKIKALEHIHDVSLDTDAENGHTDSLDSSLEKTAVEIMSILEESQDKIKPNLKRIPSTDVKEDIKRSSSQMKHKEKKNKKEVSVKSTEDTIRSEYVPGNILENEEIHCSNAPKVDVCDDDEGENKRRSRRACKVNTYNENDLAEAIFLQATAEKEKEKLKKKKIENSTTETTQEKKMNADELFDLLKATAVTENFSIPKPIEERFPDDIGEIEDNFDDVFDDILKKSEALFRDKSVNEDDTSIASKSTELNDLKKNKNHIRKTFESEEPLYCDICKKSFKRIETLVKHKTTLTHISKLSEIEAKQAEDKLRVATEYNDSLKSNPEEIGKSNDSDSLYSYPPTPGNDALKIAEIITNAFEKPLNADGFSEIIPPVSQYRRYKSLGERKSFESDQGNSNISDNLDSNSYEPHIANNAGVILQKQLTLLQNMIENRNLDYIDDVSMASYPSLEQNNDLTTGSIEAAKLEESNLAYPPNNCTSLDKNCTEAFLKPPQVEDISEDSLNVKTNEDVKSRKVLNRDEELFLECCSLLKSGSEVSNFSKKSNKTVINNVALKMSDEPDMFESKNLIEKVTEESSDCTRMATPLGDSFGDTSNSNTISSNWGLNKEEQIEIQDENYFNFKPQTTETDNGSHSSKFKDLVSKAIKIPFKNVTKFIKNRKHTPPEPCFDDEERDAASKVATKGALKIFEGLKVSIPTEVLNLEEVLNNSPPAKKIDADELSDQQFLSPKTPRNVRKSKPIKNKQQIDDRFIFKVKKKSPQKEIDEETPDKINDVYDFEETQDNTDVFAKPEFKTLRKGPEEVKNDNVFEINYEAQNLSSSSSSMNSVIKKPKTNECITKKKHMIMGRIFKNAMKPKMDEEIRDLPIIDHNDLVENYVLSCSPKVEDEFKKPKMTEEEMNYLFDKLLDKPMEDSKKLNQNKPESKNLVLKKKLKKKRQRSNSDSTDDEFGLNKIVKKRPSRKNAKVEDNSINLEQELKECIGVASRKSQRKCTSGKQNVLVEYWSSDESAFEAFLENHLQELSAKTEIPVAKTEDTDDKPKKIETVRKSTEKDTKIKKKPKVLTKKRPSKEAATGDYAEPSTQPNRRKRTAAHPLYHWSSSSEDETQDLIEVKSIRDDPEDEYDEDRPIQHGWIVGDSPKKLVTMLAQAKGKKTEPESSVKEQGKKKNCIS